MRTLVVLSLALILTGCGFQLRGWQEGGEPLGEIGLEGDPHDLFYQAVAEQLRANGARLTENGNPAVRLVRAGISRRAASLDQRGKVSEYELNARLVFRLEEADKRDAGKPVTLTASRTYLYDADNINAMQAEENLLRQELRQNLARQLVIRLRALLARSSR